MNIDAMQEFDKHVAGSNVMTPTRVDVGWTEDGDVYELSTGTDFDRQPMWGVTVVVDGKIDTDRGRLFNEGTTEQRHAAALAYIEDELY